MNKEHINNTGYTPPTVEVMTFTAQGVLCQSGTINGLNPREDDTEFWG